jgi:hypothetical protein
MSLQTITQILQTVNSPVPKKSNFFFEGDTPTKKFTTDPVVLGVALKRMQTVYGLKDCSEHITPEDQEQARKIRDYYRKKYFWNALKSQATQSDFRMRVSNLLNQQDEWNLTEKDTGIFVKLPYFYEEDTVYDEFKKLYKINQEDYYIDGFRLKKTRLLTHIGTTLRWQANKRKSFWFKDHNDIIYAVSVPHNTPFIGLFEDTINHNINVEFSARVDRVDGMFYNEIAHNFKIVKE